MSDSKSIETQKKSNEHELITKIGKISKLSDSVQNDPSDVMMDLMGTTLSNITLRSQSFFN